MVDLGLTRGHTRQTALIREWSGSWTVCASGSSPGLSPLARASHDVVNQVAHDRRQLLDLVMPGWFGASGVVFGPAPRRR